MVGVKRLKGTPPGLVFVVVCLATAVLLACPVSSQQDDDDDSKYQFHIQCIASLDRTIDKERQPSIPEPLQGCKIITYEDH